MFSRRVPRSRLQKLRELLWPSMGIFRLVRYYQHRVGRLPGSPQFIAAGFATGFAISFTPFIGFHLLLGMVACFIFRMSVVAMLIGTMLGGNPWTFPFFWVGTYKVGEMIFGKDVDVSDIPAKFTWVHLMKKPVELLLPMTIGSIPFILVVWPVCFLVARELVRGYRKTESRKR